MKNNFNEKEIKELKEMAENHFYHKYVAKYLYKYKMFSLFISIISLASSTFDFKQWTKYSILISTCTLTGVFLVESLDYSSLKKIKTSTIKIGNHDTHINKNPAFKLLALIVFLTLACSAIYIVEPIKSKYFYIAFITICIFCIVTGLVLIVVFKAINDIINAPDFSESNHESNDSKK